MLNENLLSKLNVEVGKFVNAMEDGVFSISDLDYSIDQIIGKYIDKEIYNEKTEEDEENPTYTEAEEYMFKMITNHGKLQVFKSGVYAWNGEYKTLSSNIICSNKYKNPFEAMEDSE